MESRRRPRWPPPAHPKLLSVDGQSGPLDEQAPEVALDARKPNRCVLGSRNLRRPGSDPRPSPGLLRHRSPRAAELAIPRFVARPSSPPDSCLERDNVSRCAAIRPGFKAGSPRTPRDARIRATGRPAGPLQRATHGSPCQARTLAALLVHLPGRCAIRGGDPRCRRWSGVWARRGRCRPQRLPRQSPKRRYRSMASPRRHSPRV